MAVITSIAFDAPFVECYFFQIEGIIIYGLLNSFDPIVISTDCRLNGDRQFKRRVSYSWVIDFLGQLKEE